MSKISYLSKETHARWLTNCIQSINMSEDDRVSFDKHSNTTKSFHLLEIPNTDKNLATIIVFDNSKRKTTGGVNMGVVVQRHLSVYRTKNTRKKSLEKTTYEKTLHLEQARTSTKQQNNA